MMDSYNETRIIMAPSGELLLALPIYADQSSSILTPVEVESIIGVAKIGIGIYENFGYLIYHPSQEVSFYLKSIDLFEDLGLL